MREAFPKKGKRERERRKGATERQGGKERGKKEKIQLQRRYNYKFPTRTAELFVRGTRQSGERAARGKKGRKRQFR